MILLQINSAERELWGGLAPADPHKIILREELLHLVDEARALRRMLVAAFLERIIELFEKLLLSG